MDAACFSSIESGVAPCERPPDETMRCPFLRAMLSAPDAPKWNPRTQVMNVDDMIKFVRDEPPGDGTLHQVLRFITVANHGVGNRVQRLGRLANGKRRTVLDRADWQMATMR